MPMTPASCFVAFLSLGDLTVGGTRPVVVHVPPSYEPGIATPLLIALHGYSDSNYIEGYLRLQSVANSRGILYAYPDGTLDCRGRRFWNAGSSCCNICGSDIDDSAYLRRIITETQAALNVDATRIYVIGHSNGGFMSYRMACEHSDAVAAIASIAGASYADPADCVPTSGVHVLQIHGTSDGTIKYGGGTLAEYFGLPDPSALPYPGAVPSVEEWAIHDGCALSAALGPPLDLDQSIPGSETSVTRYMDGCQENGSADLWSIQGGSHRPDFGSGFANRLVDWLLKHPKGVPTRAAFTSTPETTAPQIEVGFDGSISTAIAGAAITSHAWDFGDGAVKTGVLAPHAYASPGRYLVSLTIETDTGQVDTTSRPVTVRCPSGEVEPWIGANVGDPAFASSVQRAAGEILEICAGGSSFGTVDRFFLVYQELAGDRFELTTRVAGVEQGTAGSFVGLTIRESISDGARFGAVGFDLGSQSDPKGTFRFRFRMRDGTPPATRSGSPLAAWPCWLRLERDGETVRGFSVTVRSYPSGRARRILRPCRPWRTRHGTWTESA